ncbi:hypothetical protein ACHAXS_008946 [Conticribra weissflogii]
MTVSRSSIIAFAAMYLASNASSFSPTVTLSSIQKPSIPNGCDSRLFGLIRGEAVDEVALDENEGGVGLAKRSAIKISGISRKGQKCEAQELVRYEAMKELEVASAKSTLEKAGCTILCNGMGEELYQDPGTSTRYEDKLVKFGPSEAAKAALGSVATEISCGGAKSVVFNFLGGDDLIIGEVMDACDMLVSGMELSEKTKIIFNSISFRDFKEGTCSVTVVASEGQRAGLKGEDASLANGELYIYDGKWYSVAEDGITTETN